MNHGFFAAKSLLNVALHFEFHVRGGIMFVYGLELRILL